MRLSILRVEEIVICFYSGSAFLRMLRPWGRLTARVGSKSLISFCFHCKLNLLWVAVRVGLSTAEKRDARRRPGQDIPQPLLFQGVGEVPAVEDR